MTTKRSFSLTENDRFYFMGRVFFSNLFWVDGRFEMASGMVVRIIFRFEY